MKLFPKTFRCQTQLTLDQCKHRIQDKFPKSSFSQIRLTSFVEDGDAASFTLVWAGGNNGIFAIRLDATLTQKSDHVQIMGNARPMLLGLLLALYFPVISLVLVFVFLPILWLSAFFLVVFFGVAWMIYNTFQARTRLIDKVCLALER